MKKSEPKIFPFLVELSRAYPELSDDRILKIFFSIRDWMEGYGLLDEPREELKDDKNEAIQRRSETGKDSKPEVKKFLTYRWMTSNQRKRFGQNVQHIITHHKITRTEFAKRVSMAGGRISGSSVVSNWINGVSFPTTRNVRAICRAMKLQPHDLGAIEKP